MNIEKETIPYWIEQQCEAAEAQWRADHEWRVCNSPVIEEREFWGEIDIEFLKVEEGEE